MRAQSTVPDSDEESGLIRQVSPELPPSMPVNQQHVRKTDKPRKPTHHPRAGDKRKTPAPTHPVKRQRTSAPASNGGTGARINRKSKSKPVVEESEGSETEIEEDEDEDEPESAPEINGNLNAEGEEAGGVNFL